MIETYFLRLFSNFFLFSKLILYFKGKKSNFLRIFSNLFQFLKLLLFFKREKLIFKYIYLFLKIKKGLKAKNTSAFFVLLLFSLLLLLLLLLFFGQMWVMEHMVERGQITTFWNDTLSTRGLCKIHPRPLMNFQTFVHVFLFCACPSTIKWKVLTRASGKFVIFLKTNYHIVF